MALMSGKVYSNTGAPNNADGVNGDIYMQLDGFKTTYRKEGGSWVAVGSTLGAIPEFVSGIGTPSNSLGADGQYYRDTDNQDIYYKQGATWNIIGNFAVSTKLAQAGIGKYLGTAPNLVTTGSMNDLIIAGEYYVTDSVTDRPTGVSSGYVKVWGLDSSNVAQIVQRTIGSSVFELHFRQSSGGVFGNWQSLAASQGSSTNDFQVLGGTTPNSAVAYSQLATLLESSQDIDSFKLPDLMGGWKFKWGYTFLGDDIPATAHTTTITGFTEIKTVLVGSTTTDNYGAFVYHRQSFNNNSVTVVFDEWSSQTQDGLGYWWFAIGK